MPAIKRSFSYQSEGEVEDSEPEREEARKREREARKQAKLQALAIVCPQPDVSTSTPDDLMGLKRFTFELAKPKIPTNILSAVSRVSSSTVAARDPTVRHRSTNINNDYLGYSHSKFQNISKCVSCDIKWTTRKSSSQKIAHMKSCAKSRRLTEDTMATLVGRVFLETNTKGLNKGGEQRISPPNETHRTLLEDTINTSRVPNKTRRRQQLDGTVRSVVDTRQEILDRARALLRNDDDPATMPPATQYFGKSKLGTTYSLSTIVLTESDSGAEDSPVPSGSSAVVEKTNHTGQYSAPPLTQAIPKSRLQQLYAPTSKNTRVARLFDEDEDTLEPDGDPSLEVDSYDDGAILHFEGSASYGQSFECKETETPNVTVNGRSKRDTTARVHSETSPSADCLSGDDFDFDSTMESLIKQDKELHMRILRYEPIYIDVFIQLMERKGIKTRGTKPRLRAFLDKQAINFYDSSTNGRSRH